MTRPGVYGLASLDGSPLLADDLGILAPSDDGDGWERAEGFAVRGVDYGFATDSIGIFRGQNLLVVFAGYLDEAADVSAALGMGAETPPVGLAMAAVERYGRNAPTQMFGAWSLLRWETDARKLTIVTSESCRDAVFFATDGRRVAFAPDMLRLGRLPWVGQELDPIYFPLQISVARLRHIKEGSTLWKGVRQVMPRTTEVFTPGGRATFVAEALPEPEPWQGSFEDAVAEADALGRRIVRQQLERYGRVGLMLSGGLDSTLVACWAAEEAGVGREVFCVSSVAPPESGLEDERRFSSGVAERLGLELTFHYPDAARSAYVPDRAWLDSLQMPVLDLRHHVTSLLYQAVAERGGLCCMTGSGGEFTVTDPHPMPRVLSWPLRVARDVRNWLREHRTGLKWPEDGFMARLAPEVYAGLPREWKGIWQAGPPKRKPTHGMAPRGTYPAIEKGAGFGSATPYGIRSHHPLVDRRLIRLVSRMPLAYMHQGGLNRAMARKMLDGRVPDFVRLRKDKMPYSPDYDVRLARQAEETRARVALYRRAGVGKWLDVDGISAGLERLANGTKPRTADEHYEAQLNVLVAEFLLWSQSQTNDGFTQDCPNEVCCKGAN